MNVKTTVKTLSGAVLMAVSSLAVAAQAQTAEPPPQAASAGLLQDSRSSLRLAQTAPARASSTAASRAQPAKAQVTRAQAAKAQPGRIQANQQPASTQANPPPAAVRHDSPPAAPPRSAITTLSLRENHLLSQDIDAWAKSQGLHPLWNSSRDYLIFSSIHLSGKNRDEVLNQLGQLFRSENYGLVIRLYEKNNVLVIDSQ